MDGFDYIVEVYGSNLRKQEQGVLREPEIAPLVKPCDEL